MSLTNADLAQQITSLISRWDTYTRQLRDWLAGTADGGPYGDGRYPLQNSLGQVFYVPCPAAQSAMVEGNAASAESFATEAATHALAAAGAKAATETARDLALTYRDAAQTAKALAEYASSEAQTAEANARYWAQQAQGSAEDIDAVASGIADTADAVAADRVAAEAARVAAEAAQTAAELAAQQAATFDPAYYALVGHTHTIAEVAGLQAALDGKQPAGSYAAASHGHAIADVTGLQAALDGKQPVGSYAAASHGHAIADIAGLANRGLEGISVVTDANATRYTGGGGVVFSSFGPSAANAPGSNYYHAISVSVNGTSYSQLALRHGNATTKPEAWIRHGNSTGDGAWARLWDSNNLTPAAIGAAEASHTHSASQITSGKFSQARIPHLSGNESTGWVRLSSNGDDADTMGSIRLTTGGASFVYTFDGSSVLSCSSAGNLRITGYMEDMNGWTRRTKHRVANGSGNLNADLDLNGIVEKTNTSAVTWTVPASFGTAGDIITIINSGTSGNITVARASGVTFYRGGSSVTNVVVTPGNIVNLVKVSAANRWQVAG